MILKPIEPKKNENLNKTSEKDAIIPEKTEKSARSKSSDSFLNDMSSEKSEDSVSSDSEYKRQKAKSLSKKKKVSESESESSEESQNLTEMEKNQSKRGPLSKL